MDSVTVLLIDGTTLRFSNATASVDPIEQALVMQSEDGEVHAKFNWEYVFYYYVNAIEV